MAQKTELKLWAESYQECPSPAALSCLGMAQRMEAVDGTDRQRRERVWDSVNETIEWGIKDVRREAKRGRRRPKDKRKVKGSMAEGCWRHCRLCEPGIIDGRIWKHKRSGGEVYELFIWQFESMAGPGMWL